LNNTQIFTVCIIEKAIIQLKGLMTLPKLQLQRDDLKFAISALEKQAEREKGCEYCNGDNPPELSDMDENTIYYNSLYGKFYSDNYELEWKACPMCGREFKDWEVTK
jgi:hypothetical protein